MFMKMREEDIVNMAMIWIKGVAMMVMRGEI